MTQALVDERVVVNPGRAAVSMPGCVARAGPVVADEGIEPAPLVAGVVLFRSMDGRTNEGEGVRQTDDDG